MTQTREMNLLIVARMHEQLKETIEQVTRFRPPQMDRDQHEKIKRDMNAQLDALEFAIFCCETFIGLTVDTVKKEHGDARRTQ